MSDEIQDHRLGNLETRVERHGIALDDLTNSVSSLTSSVEITNSLLRESLSAMKKVGASIITISVALFGAGQVI